MTLAAMLLCTSFTLPVGEGGQQVQQQAMPPAAPRATQRVLSLTAGAGRGWLALNDNLGRDGQGAWTFTARLNVGFARNWMLYMGGEASGTSRGDSRFVQTAWLVGVQTFVAGRVSLRGGVGPTHVTEKPADSPSQSVGPGWAWSVGIGLEASRSAHAAFGFEATYTSGTFARERWDMGGLNAVFSAF